MQVMRVPHTQKSMQTYRFYWGIELKQHPDGTWVRTEAVEAQLASAKGVTRSSEIEAHRFHFDGIDLYPHPQGEWMKAKVAEQLLKELT